MSSAAGFSSLGDAIKYLDTNLPKRVQPYSLGILGPRGQYVEFQAPADAISRLRAGVFRPNGFAQSIRDLAKAKGPRAIVYLTNRRSNPPRELISAARYDGALIYAVGGNVYQNYIFSSQGISFPLAVDPSQAKSAISSTFVWAGVRSIRTVYMEHSLRKAFQEMRSVSRGLYELTVDSAGPIETVTIQPKIPGEYQLSASAYSDGDAPPLTLVLAK